jgi:endoglucanase
MLATTVLGCAAMGVALVPASAATAPAIAITSPVSGGTLIAPATVTFTATESGGAIAKVEFFNGATLLGVRTARPYTFNWANVPAGIYTLTAKAFDSKGNVGASSAVSLHVNALAAAGAPAASVASSTAPRLHVRGSELVDSSGAQVILHGVGRSGTEYECVSGNGIFSGPSDQASITAMKSWGINAVRIPLNEACWNGESYVNSAYRGAEYQSAIKSYVSLLNANGMVAILDLHWTDGLYTGPGSGCSSAKAVCQKPMPDAAESVRFWTSVATAFKGNDAAVFDLFNEPFPEAADRYNETEGWRCWLSGGSSCVGISYPVAGMRTLVNTVRNTGASNVIMLGGTDWANDLSEWLSYEPAGTNLVAAWHSYNVAGSCDIQSCWTSEVAPVIARVPVIAGEIGEYNCADTYIAPLMAWLDSEHTSYLAWAWDAWTGMCDAPVLISNYNGTPTGYGAGYEAHLRSLKNEEHHVAVGRLQEDYTLSVPRIPSTALTYRVALPVVRP